MSDAIQKCASICDAIVTNVCLAGGDVSEEIVGKALNDPKTLSRVPVIECGKACSDIFSETPNFDYKTAGPQAAIRVLYRSQTYGGEKFICRRLRISKLSDLVQVEVPEGIKLFLGIEQKTPPLIWVTPTFPDHVFLSEEVGPQDTSNGNWDWDPLKGWDWKREIGLEGDHPVETPNGEREPAKPIEVPAADQAVAMGAGLLTVGTLGTLMIAGASAGTAGGPLGVLVGATAGALLYYWTSSSNSQQTS